MAIRFDEIAPEKEQTKCETEVKPSISPRKRAPNNTFDRKAYMREYMRLRRKTEKQSK